MAEIQGSYDDLFTAVPAHWPRCWTPETSAPQRRSS